MSDIEEKFIFSIKNGNFLEVIYQAYFDMKGNYDETHELGVMLSGLHNDGKLNLIDEFLKLKNEAGKRDFFTLRHGLHPLY